MKKEEILEERLRIIEMAIIALANRVERGDLLYLEKDFEKLFSPSHIVTED